MSNTNTEPTGQTPGEGGSSANPGGQGGPSAAQQQQQAGNQNPQAGDQGQTRNPQSGEVVQLTQSALDGIIQGRLAEQARSFEQRLQTERQRWETEAAQRFQQERDAAIQDAIRAHDLERERQSLVQSMQLTEAQAAVLQGDTADALRAHAEALYGNRTQAPPVIQPGGNQRPIDGNNVEAQINAAFAKMTGG